MNCRRTFLATLGILCLTGLGIYKGMDVAMPIAGIVAAIGAANAAERSNIAKAEAGQNNTLSSK